jgi:hypothetical protein
MTAPTAATTGTPSVAAVSIEFPRLVLASAPRPARVPWCRRARSCWCFQAGGAHPGARNDRHRSRRHAFRRRLRNFVETLSRTTA